MAPGAKQCLHVQLAAVFALLDFHRTNTAPALASNVQPPSERPSLP